MVEFDVKDQEMRNAPTQLAAQITSYLKRIEGRREIYAVLYVNPSEDKTPQLLAITRSVNTPLPASQSLIIKEYPWSHFWIHLQQANPIAQEYLRKSAVIFDRGYLRALQELLFQGKMRPSKESTWNALVQSQEALKQADGHVKQAAVDLYWSMVDAAQALLAAVGEVPSTPKQMPFVLSQKIVSRKLLTQDQVEDFKQVFTVAKRIDHHEVFSLTGSEYRGLEKKAEAFLSSARKIIKQAARLP